MDTAPATANDGLPGIREQLAEQCNAMILLLGDLTMTSAVIQRRDPAP